MLWINICKINKMEIQKRSYFWAVPFLCRFFGTFLSLNIANIQEPAEILFVSQPVWSLCKRLWITCGPVPGIFQTSITDALISPTTPAKLTWLYFLRPEYKRPLKSQIRRLRSGTKTERIFATIRTLHPGSAPSAHESTTKRAGNGYI